jgi:hypothetical protein
MAGRTRGQRDRRCGRHRVLHPVGPRRSPWQFPQAEMPDDAWHGPGPAGLYQLRDPADGSQEVEGRGFRGRVSARGRRVPRVASLRRSGHHQRCDQQFQNFGGCALERALVGDDASLSSQAALPARGALGTTPAATIRAVRDPLYRRQKAMERRGGVEGGNLVALCRAHRIGLAATADAETVHRQRSQPRLARRDLQAVGPFATGGGRSDGRANRQGSRRSGARRVVGEGHGGLGIERVGPKCSRFAPSGGEVPLEAAETR